MATLGDAGGRPVVPEGQVRVEAMPGGRLLVEIGRAKWVKRLNVSREEARVLAVQLLLALADGT